MTDQEYKQERDRVAQRIQEECLIVDWASKMGIDLERHSNSTLRIKGEKSHVIYPNKNDYCNYSSGEGGGVINFLVEFGEMDRKSVFKMLAESIGEKVGNGMRATIPKVERSTPRQEAVIKPPFILPPKNNITKNVFAYLTKTRGIAGDIVNNLVDRGLIYQDKQKNCVFVGYADDGVAKFACKRSTNTSGKKYAADVTSSDGGIGWRVTNGGNKLVVAEAPIDVMSVMTKLLREKKDLKSYDFIGLSGVSKIRAINEYIKGHLAVKTVVCCYDKDRAGIEAWFKTQKLLRDNNIDVEIISAFPKRNDYNDDIRKLEFNPDELAYKINEDNVPTERWLNPYIAEVIQKLDIPLGFVLNNDKYLTKDQERESWYVPLKSDDHIMKLFKEGKVCVINPSYGTEHEIKNLTEFMDKVYLAKLTEELKEFIDTSDHKPTLNEMKMAVGAIVNDRGKSIISQLQNFDKQIKGQGAKGLCQRIPMQ